MGTSLYWKRIVPQKENYLDDQLKFILRKRYGYGFSEVMDLSDVSYLEGLVDAGVKGAQDLIDAIRDNEQVKVTES